MERFTLAQAAAWTKGEARGEAVLTAVTTDSRQIPPEALFLPIKASGLTRTISSARRSRTARPP